MKEICRLKFLIISIAVQLTCFEHGVWLSTSHDHRIRAHPRTLSVDSESHCVQMA